MLEAIPLALLLRFYHKRGREFLNRDDYLAVFLGRFGDIFA